jgi:hypothetical protein
VTTGGERFVRTADMRAVIKGREADLLDALNIPWRAGNAHIRCPYPGHSDANPSWHSDRRKDRAYSTCVAGAHTALDMLMAVEEATFEAAKIRGADWALVQHRSQNPGDPPFPFPRTQRVKPTIAAEQNWNQRLPC